MSQQEGRNVTGAHAIGDGARALGLGMASHLHRIYPSHLNGQACLKAAKGSQPVVLIAAGRLDTGVKPGSRALFDETRKHLVELLVALKGIIQLKRGLGNLSLLINDDEVGIALTNINTEKIVRHGSREIKSR